MPRYRFVPQPCAARLAALFSTRITFAATAFCLLYSYLLHGWRYRRHHVVCGASSRPTVTVTIGLTRFDSAASEREGRCVAGDERRRQNSAAAWRRRLLLIFYVTRREQHPARCSTARGRTPCIYLRHLTPEQASVFVPRMRARTVGATRLHSPLPPVVSARGASAIFAALPVLTSSLETQRLPFLALRTRPAVLSLR